MRNGHDHEEIPGAGGETESFYENRGFAGRVGFGSSPALLVIDFILGFTDPSSPLATNLDDPIRETRRLLTVARDSGIPVIFTTVEYDSSLKDAGLFPRKAAGLKWLVAGSRWVEVDPRLERRSGEILITKKYASAFFGTALGSSLCAQGVDTVILTGCTTSGCVRATAVDALQHGFRAIVPRTAVGDRAEGPHRANLFDIDMKYGDVISVEEAVQHLRSLPARGSHGRASQVSS